jgi:NAD(P)-dependent dehydrogenase (short-subunit alcohol dehydrogenase family)
MQLFDLTGKTALITGASSGLGEQFARCLSNAGARVILLARRLDKLQILANELGNTLALEMDVSDKKSIKSIFDHLESLGEKIDICINNAGIAHLTPIFEDDEEEIFEKTMQTNFMGTWYVSKFTANHMKLHSIPGSIINIGSVNGDALPAKGGSAYSVSKSAVIHLTKTLVDELSPHKIRINCISPGWFKTPMNGPEVEAIIPHIPHGYVAPCSDMDGLILYLSSNQASSYVTGSCFTIDGGASWSGSSW